MSGRVPAALAAAVVLGFLGVFFAWPVAAIIGLGLGGAGPVLAEAATWRLPDTTLVAQVLAAAERYADCLLYTSDAADE